MFINPVRRLCLAVGEMNNDLCRPVLGSLTCIRGACEINIVTVDDIISENFQIVHSTEKSRTLKIVSTRCLCFEYLLFPLHVTILG